MLSKKHPGAELNSQIQSAQPRASLSRRKFLSRAAVTAGSALAASGLGSKLFAGSRQAQQTEQPPAGRYVDIHTHLGQVWNTYEPLTAEQLIRWMDANDVAQAIVLPLVNPESSSYPLTTDFVLRETKPHRERLIPFCSIDPRTSFSGGQAGLVEMLTRYKEAGALGFGEHKPGIAMDDPRNLELYTACGEAELPVLFHLDAIRNTDKPGLPGVERVLEACPQTTFIGHGPGWWASISAQVNPEDLDGYPKGPVVEGGALDRLMENHENIYGDLSAGSGANAIQRDADFGRDFLIRRADRLLFGTDFLRPRQDVPQLALYRDIDLPEDVAKMVYRDNARQLLGLVRE